MYKKILFLFGCIGSRLLLSLYSKKYYSKIFNFVTFLIGLSFIFLYVFDLRKTGLEATNNIIWWNELRPIHGSFYLLFSIYYLKNNNNIAWIFLFIDTLIGLFVYITKLFSLYYKTL